MNKDAQEIIQEQIDDYILGLLSDKNHRKIKTLIANNTTYNEYYLQQIKLVELIQKNDVPDPGPEFWNKFPDQILEQCHSKQKISFFNNGINWWASVLTKTSFFQPAMGFALVLAIVIILVNPSNNSEIQQFSPLAMQNILWQKTLPTNNMLNSLEIRKNNTYSFFKTDSSNVFSAGKNLSLSMAYFKNKNYVQSAKILESLKGMNNDEVLNELISSLKNDDLSPSKIVIKYNNLLTQFEKQFSTDDYNLFNAGSWLAYLEMAMVSKQYSLLKKLNQSQYILKKLKLQSLPESIYRHLQQLDGLLNKDQFNRKELTKIKWHISSIQNVLG